MNYFLHLTSMTESDLITNTFIILISQILFAPNSLRLPWDLTQGLHYAPKLQLHVYFTKKKNYKKMSLKNLKALRKC